MKIDDRFPRSKLIVRMALSGSVKPLVIGCRISGKFPTKASELEDRLVCGACSMLSARFDDVIMSLEECWIDWYIVRCNRSPVKRIRME